MEILKLTSIRLSVAALAKANDLASEFGYYQSSHVIRVAIWIGMKVLNPKVIFKLSKMMWEEEERDADFSLEDVLRSAGVIENDTERK